jgi:hypothetical protein
VSGICALNGNATSASKHLQILTRKLRCVCLPRLAGCLRCRIICWARYQRPRNMHSFDSWKHRAHLIGPKLGLYVFNYRPSLDAGEALCCLQDLSVQEAHRWSR